MIAAKGYAAQAADTPLAPFSFNRRDPGPKDVHIRIRYCGICHSDIHTARGEWPGTVWPCVPGHEIVGHVIRAGRDVKKFKEGDVVGVGCMVDSCRACPSCRLGLEQYCDNGFIGTYNSPDKHLGGMTLGGYSNEIVVDESFVLRVREKDKLAAVAPLLCAGITTYSPLRHWGVGKGHKVGIVGLGGLGHMGVKIAAALGAHVVLFTTSTNKTEDAKRLGAHEVVLSKDPGQMAAHAGSFDYILDTVSAEHDVNAYLNLLKLDGNLTLVGAPMNAPVVPFSLIMKRRRFSGSLIGGIPETQEMLDFCADRGIVSDVEIIRPDQINEAWTRVVKSDVKYRFVIDMEKL